MDIEEIVNNIFVEYYHIDFNKNKELKNYSLLGKKLKFSPRDLVILLVKIEDKLNITIPNKLITDGRFRTFSQIVEVCNQVKEVLLQ